MLLELRIQNLLLVEDVELLLEPGLNVITGETGAGKTMLAQSLDLLLGGKPPRDIVRPGAREAYVEGVLEAPVGLAEDPELADLRERVDCEGRELVLARRVTAEGRSRAYLQGRSVSAADLRAIGTRLLSFYGQHEHRKLTLAAAQLDVLDGFCGPRQLETRARYRREWARSAALRRQLEELRERSGARERDLDLLDFEIREIEQASPTESEQLQLESEGRRLESAHTLRAAVDAALRALDPAPDDPDERGAAERLALAAADLERAAMDDPELEALSARCGSLLLETRELVRELSGYSESLQADPARLELVTERLDLFSRLARKHGGTIAAVLDHAERCRNERERLANAADESARLEDELRSAEAELRGLAAKLSDARRKAAGKLSKAVRAELDALAMQDAAFEARLEPVEGGDAEGLGARGAETVEFVIAPNPGVRAGSLREIASGGELSRVMLALMTIATAAADAPTVVFDEVDAGVGGNTARAIGAKLRSLGRARQVICITHLPQVASQATRHFRVTKSAGTRASGDAAIARTDVERLEDGQVVAEICRMLGADAADSAARRHAEKLLQAA